MITGLRTILITISSSWAINVDRFKDYCYSVYGRYLQCYSWNRLSWTVHKLLVHGHEILAATPPGLSVGDLSEMPLESAHKDRKEDQVDHTRKVGRPEMMEDFFWRAFDVSDPQFLHASLQKRVSSRKVLRYPPAVVALFENFDGLVEGDDVQVDIVAQIFDDMQDAVEFEDNYVQ